MDTPNPVTIYTDGACLGNPGPGGYGVIVRNDGRRIEKSGGFRLTTNNRMEITAAIVALETLPERCKVSLYSDSSYLVNAMTLGWVKNWKKNNWIKSDKKPALNADLWEKLYKLCEKHEVEFKWVRSHHGNPDNEKCDRLATGAARGPDLKEDKGYEKG